MRGHFQGRGLALSRFTDEKIQGLDVAGFTELTESLHSRSIYRIWELERSCRRRRLHNGPGRPAAVTPVRSLLPGPQTLRTSGHFRSFFNCESQSQSINKWNRGAIRNKSNPGILSVEVVEESYRHQLCPNTPSLSSSG